ncbi:hypothetical protein BS47DRAFT_1344739 [Hydnum rufescens UP504]|uniref:FAD-binding PCMH-type domain-containing protein n=1 Tax=Hydnum rufescens UP504 TaxID=1448309 RepID=A0A9P6AW56_9AGAM|nr:hypothetical protein BS47DRAFT_1344739 [Hydnum rufescens UP504]
MTSFVDYLYDATCTLVREQHAVKSCRGNTNSRAVGFSGLALGGWACDRFRSLDVVLTNGRLVTATATNEYSDLFTALKGGGSRFGIVTRYEVDAIHVGTAADKTYWGGSINYVGPTSAAVVKAIDALIYSNKDPNTVIVTVVTYSNVFAEFLAIPAVATNLGPLSYNEVSKVPSRAQAPGIGPRATNVYGGSTLYPGQGLFAKSYNNWLNFSTSFKDEVPTAALVITPVFQSQIDVSRAHGGTSFTPPNGSILPLGVTKISQSLRAGLDRLYHEIPRSPGLPLYLNESEDVQDALTTYSGYEKLKEIYRKYDPTRFNVRRMVGPNGL